MTTTKVKKPTAKQQQVALDLVAAWLGPEMGYPNGEPAKTGKDAAYRGLGPDLIPDWEGWFSPAWPTILLEGGPADWSIEASADPMLRAALKSHGLRVEPATHYALSIHRLDA